MHTNKSWNSRKLVLTALLAALTAIGSGLRITLPLSVAGFASFHLGNILCVLSGLLLGPWLGGLAAGMGSAIFDLLNPMFISEAWLTFLMKGLYGLAAGAVAQWGGARWGKIRAVLAAVCSAVLYGAVYLVKSYFYDGRLIAGLDGNAAWLTVVEKVPATVFNGMIAVVFAPVLALSVRKALEKSGLYPQERR